MRQFQRRLTYRRKIMQKILTVLINTNKTDIELAEDVEAALNEMQDRTSDGNGVQPVAMVRPMVGAFKERNDVLAFHQKFEIPMAKEPSFLLEDAFQFRLKFMQEELNEFEDGHTKGDMHEAADALVDLIYVVHGTALMMGLPWPMLWHEVQRANMAKIRVENASQSKRGSKLDIVKPAGWVAPNHDAAVGLGPFPIFDHEVKE
jgi:hypothetical protein